MAGWFCPYKHPIMHAQSEFLSLLAYLSTLCVSFKCLVE